MLSQGLLANRAICRTTYVGSRGVQWRRYSSPVTAPGVLPLEGIRVLDMTRVLAGVSAQLNLRYRALYVLTAFSLIVHKYWEIWGMQIIELSLRFLAEQQITAQM